MQEVIEYLFKSILPEGASLKVTQMPSEESMNTDVFEIEVPKEEIAKVIGKGGAVIRSIRILASIASKKQGRQLRLNLVESK